MRKNNSLGNSNGLYFPISTKSLKETMASLSRTSFIGIILILLIVQIHGGYWVCDWVSGRGWIYCTHGSCTKFGSKRSIVMKNEQLGPKQFSDGTFCFDRHLCYTCESIDDDVCDITLQTKISPLSKPSSLPKRSDEDICS